MDLTNLASGSKGNCSLIDGGEGLILIDAGISGKKIFERIDESGKNPVDLQGLLITHDHRDHISGAGIVSRKLKIPIYTSRIVYEQNKEIFDKCEVKVFEEKFYLAGILVTPIPVSHDGSDNHSFIFEKNDFKIGHVTDLGIVTSLVRERLRGCNILLIESNHDPKMLINGPYPWYLKQRIAGKKGHLANKDTSDLIDQIYFPELKHVILAHLSEENNDPVLAYDNMDKMRSEKGFEFTIHVAKQNRILPSLGL
ncbi:MAG: MBL fold metallo-hydrolase [Candidatus Delongbacteria bacterium]|nr:MBL fold metallo-hydrolase [Candidatus Delongbacteria bacterium]MBN2835750.1 MBL fold metallo-hydrolase [Candidatus Delongbacteria bacterium]